MHMASAIARLIGVWVLCPPQAVIWTDATIHQQFPCASRGHFSPIKPTSVGKWRPLRAKNETYYWHESVLLFSVAAFHIWNTLPTDLKQQSTTTTFKRKLEDFSFRTQLWTEQGTCQVNNVMGHIGLSCICDALEIAS